MFTATLTFLNTPVFNYAAAQYVGSLLLFIAGPTLVYQQQQMQGTLPSLSQRQCKVLQISLGTAAIFLFWGVPFTTTLPLALTYALFLIVSGLAGMGVALRKDPNWVKINEDIMKVDTNLRKHLGISPNMGYTKVPKIKDKSLPAKKNLDGENHPHCHIDVFHLHLPKITPSSEDDELLNMKHMVHEDPYLLPEGQDSVIIHVDEGSNFFIKRAGKTLPERLPEDHEITSDDLTSAQENYETIYPSDLNFLVGKKVKDIDDLSRLIVAHDREFFKKRHEIIAPLWRFLCEQYSSYTDEAAHPFKPKIIVKKKTV